MGQSDSLAIKLVQTREAYQYALKCSVIVVVDPLAEEAA